MKAGAERSTTANLPLAHTSGDIYVFFRNSNVLAVGDVASPLRDPALDYYTGAWIGGRVDAMDTLLKLSNEQTRIVPAYGPVMTRAEFKAERDMMEEVRARLFKTVREGDGPKDMLEAGVLKDLPRTWKDPEKFCMPRPRVSGLTMTNWPRMSFREANVKRFIPSVFCAAVFCIIAAAAQIQAQAPKASLAGLIQSGDRKGALARIRAGADVNEAQPDGTRPIHWAVYQVDYELLGALIAKKAKVNITNEFGSTPIAEAASLADARMVKMLLDAGAEPEGANQDGQTALMLAIKTGELPVVEMLVKAGANVNAVEKFHNQTPLMWAADAPKNAAEMVKLLLSKDASVKPRALYRDWPSQITSEPPRAVSSRRRADRIAVRGARWLL